MAMYDPDETCAFTSSDEYNRAMREVYGGAFRPVTEARFRELRKQGACGQASRVDASLAASVASTIPAPRPRNGNEAVSVTAQTTMPTGATAEYAIPVKSTAQTVTAVASVIGAIGILVMLGKALIPKRKRNGR